MKTPKHEVRNILVAGKSGSGKQPRIDVIAEELGLKQLSTGAMFRDILAKDTELAHSVRNYHDNGLWVPDEVTNKVFAEFFKQHNCSGFVLDGYPRSVGQAEFFLKLLEENNSRVDMIIEVHREDEQIIEHVQGRMICKDCNATYHIEDKPPKEGNICHKCEGKVFKRDDEKEIHNRINEFHTKVTPMIGFLKEQGVAHARIDGYLNPWTAEKVRETVREALKTNIEL